MSAWGKHRKTFVAYRYQLISINIYISEPPTPGLIRHIHKRTINAWAKQQLSTKLETLFRSITHVASFFAQLTTRMSATKRPDDKTHWRRSMLRCPPLHFISSVICSFIHCFLLFYFPRDITFQSIMHAEKSKLKASWEMGKVSPSTAPNPITIYMHFYSRRSLDIFVSITRFVSLLMGCEWWNHWEWWCIAERYFSTIGNIFVK